MLSGSIFYAIFKLILFIFILNHSFFNLCSADPVSVRQTPHRNHMHKQSEKTTRVRTVLNEKQLHTLRTCYNANPRPDALMKEQLVEMTGLSPRVIRVWFQNKRCKDKKRSILMKQLQQQHGDKTVSVLPMHFQCEKCSLPCAKKKKIQTLTSTALSDAWHLIWAEMIFIGSVIRLQCGLEATLQQTPPTVGGLGNVLNSISSVTALIYCSFLLFIKKWIKRFNSVLWCIVPY